MQSVVARLKLIPVVRDILSILEETKSHVVVREAIANNKNYAVYRARELLTSPDLTKKELDQAICVLIFQRQLHYESETT